MIILNNNIINGINNAVYVSPLNIVGFARRPLRAMHPYHNVFLSKFIYKEVC